MTGAAAKRAARAISDDRVVAVVRARSVADPARLVEVLAGAGVRCVKFTYTIPQVGAVIAAATRSGDAIVGAGTVLNEHQVREAMAAGAWFVVSPVSRRRWSGFARRRMCR